MAKDKTKTPVYVTSVLINGRIHHIHFRKERERTDFFNRVRHITGVSGALNVPMIHVYETADDALNTVANYADRVEKV